MRHQKMTKLFSYILFWSFFICSSSSAQTKDALKEKMQEVISLYHAEVGVSIMGNNKKDTLSINGNLHFPLQSVFKLHIALNILAEVDRGRFSLDQKINIEKKDLLPNLYSPIRDKYPNGAPLTLAEILKYTVAESDNVGCEILLKLLGGPEAVERYFFLKGFKDVSIKINEEVQQANWDEQFKNWTTPNAANILLAAFYANKPQLLYAKSYDFIWKTLKGTETGKNRIKGKLPANTIVAHKTGSSGANKAGVTAAVNDIGLVLLPDGQYYFISVFVTNSTEDAATNEKIIADISKLAWDYFVQKTELPKR